MCGRFTMFASDDELTRIFEIDVLEGEHGPTYNQAPSQLIRAAYTSPDGERVLGLQKWGLVPFWAKETFKPLINARSETVTEKPSFRAAVRKRRCLIPTNGYYEWHTDDEGKKTPYFLSLADKSGKAMTPGTEPIMAIAGIYEEPVRGGDGGAPGEKRAVDGNAGAVDGNAGAAPTSSLLTMEASGKLRAIHPRMPLFLPKSLWWAWLDTELTDGDEIQNLINSVPQAPLAARRVSRAVGNVRNNYPALMNEPSEDGGLLPGLENL